MDASARRSFPHVHALFALTVFAAVAFTPGAQAAHQPFARRENLLPRQGTLTLTTTTITTTTSVISNSFATSAPTPSSSSAILSSVQPSPFSESIVSSSSSSFSSSDSLSSTVSSSQSSTSSQPPSSSSSVSSTRSTSSSVQSTTSSTRPVELTPSITFAFTNNFLPTQATETSSSSSEPSPSETVGSNDAVSAAAKSGFWQNKGIVAAVFVIVSLAIVGVAIIIIIVLLKRRNMRREARLHDEIFETYNEPEFRSDSPGPSINNAPMDAFARREIGYSDNPSPTLNTNLQNQPRIVIPTSPIQHPDYYNAPSRYTPPSRMQPTAPPEVRGSTGYQPSLDSFYGAGSPVTYKPQP
ncbi:hypothetical protein NLJ89_g87 [Agrocybe chaxingu]|uniref:Transmembrane protein n=1 Tax=Agrocybe chaxingu TaxID=84603 RepID=A0A9W8N2M4_9AGAR|nr:hypothetical protein NLJ89_g87 [Agrocybe chaxingu]